MTGISPTDFATAHSVGLTRFAYVLCGDRGLADDLVQDACVAMHRRFGEWLPIAAPPALLAVPRHLPAVVLAHTDLATRTTDMITDGTSYAWLDDRVTEQLSWWHPGDAAPSRMRTPVDGLTSDLGIDAALAGDWLVTGFGTNTLVDLDTHAITAVPAARGYGWGFTGGNATGKDSEVLASGAGGQLIRLDLATLPRLACR